MESLTIFHPTGQLEGTLKLPHSKSLLNRYQVLEFLFPGTVTFPLHPDSDDARALFEGLKTPTGGRADVGLAGTAMRFLTAVFCVIPGKRILAGNAHMNNRPLAPLIAALRQLGASITCLEQEGQAPLEITGGNLRSGRVVMPAGVSSQFLSALAMIAPKVQGGIQVEWQDKAVSEPYLTMTLALLKEMGCTVEKQAKGFSVQGPVTAPLSRPLEPDWSAAGMAYGLAAVASHAELELEGLRQNSLQGDAACVKLFEMLGVHTQFSAQGAVISKVKGATWPDPIVANFVDCPDLAQPFAFAAGLLGKSAHLTGLQTLQGKETKRLDALLAELTALGLWVEVSNDTLHIHTGVAHQPKGARPTYADHRMAMAMSIAGLLFPVTLLDPGVVGKSFPGFWNALTSLGFDLTA